jgi:ATP-dependent RNA circularization protein (DNA/RNA ligase family)
MKEKKIIQRNYGSIPHLSTSKLTQQADKKIQMGQELILTKKARDWKDLIIVTEKIDGSNVGVYNDNGKIIALTRSGYTAESSPYKQHHLFSDYVQEINHIFKQMIPDKWRVVGEWCIQQHGTIYDLKYNDPFVIFDIIDEHNNRIPYLQMRELCFKYDFESVPLLHIGQPISIKNSVKLLSQGYYGHPDKPEGVVYRLEREGVVEFLAKWVRSDKQDGKFMDSETNNLNVQDRYMI